MNKNKRKLDSQRVLSRWQEIASHDEHTFIEFISCIERKDEELCAVPTENGGDASGFSIEDCRDILSTFLKFAKPKIISGRDDDFWIALSIKYSASEEVWRFLVDQVPPESIDRTNDINFYRSLSQRFPDIEWFSEVYHLSLGSHPDSKITQQAMIDSGEFARIVRQIYPEDDGRPKHKNERKRLRQKAAERFAAYSKEDRHRIIQPGLTRYFLFQEQPISAHESCQIDSPSHELLLYESEAVWRDNMDGKFSGLWRERLWLWRSFGGRNIDFFSRLYVEYVPSFTRHRESFDYQHSINDERVWNRYLCSIVDEFIERVPVWFSWWHDASLNRADFRQETEVLVRQIEETQILLETARALLKRMPNRSPGRILDSYDRRLKALKEYFLSGDTDPIENWIHERYPNDEFLA